jgi:hypothetical protein
MNFMIMTIKTRIFLPYVPSVMEEPEIIFFCLLFLPVQPGLVRAVKAMFSCQASFIADVFPPALGTKLNTHAGSVIQKHLIRFCCASCFSAALVPL